MSSRRAIFFDRDGVLNQAVVRDGKPYPPPSAAEMKIVDGAPEALARLKDMGLLLLVVTNQPDVARGTQTREAIDAMHGEMGKLLPIDEFFVCPHDDRDACGCRKPDPGLMFAARDRYDLDLAASFLVGDRWRDVDAGQAAGCRTVWIDCGYRERGPSAPPDFRAATLTEAVNWIVAQLENDVRP